MLSQLDPQEFNYSTYVSSHDGDCGTTCCVAGWYPKYFPQSRLKWVSKNGADNYGSKLTLIGPNRHIIQSWWQDPNGVEDALTDYHGLSKDVIRALFYGEKLLEKGSSEKYILPRIGLYSHRSIEDIILRFEKVRTLIDQL
jgi:hypothetical protein